MEEREQSRSGQ